LLADRRHQRARAGGLEQRAPRDFGLDAHAVPFFHFLEANKKAAARDALSGALPQSGGVACRPVIGPAAPSRAGADRPSHYKWHANSVARKKLFGINRKNFIAGIFGKPDCCHLLHRGGNVAASLCSAKK
jgi:hypothetical protein